MTRNRTDQYWISVRGKMRKRRKVRRGACKVGVKIATNHITKTHFVVNFAGCQLEIIIDAILIRVSLSVHPFPSTSLSLPIPSSAIHSFSARPHRQLMLRLMRCTRGKRLNNKLGVPTFPTLPCPALLYSLCFCFPPLAATPCPPRAAELTDGMRH